MTDKDIDARKLPDCVDKAECPHKAHLGRFGDKCMISITQPNGLHNDCKAQRFPNRKEKVTFT